MREDDIKLVLWVRFLRRISVLRRFHVTTRECMTVCQRIDLWKMIWFKNSFFNKKCSRTQMCEVHLQYGNSKTKWRFKTFFKLIPLLLILFSLFVDDRIFKNLPITKFSFWSQALTNWLSIASWNITKSNDYVITDSYYTILKSLINHLCDISRCNTRSNLSKTSL